MIVIASHEPILVHGVAIQRTKSMPHDSYANFAPLYDFEMNNPFTKGYYKFWQQHLAAATKKHKIKLTTLIDLACGTGNTTIPWVKKVKHVIGVDISRRMLAQARRKSKQVRWIQQDISHLDLNKKADAITCHYDALNHILEPRQLQQAFKKISDHLQPKGLFTFDLNTEVAFHWLHQREKLFQSGKHYYMTSNRYNPKIKIVEFRQLWFVKEGNRYKKVDVRVKERAYSDAEIRSMLKKAGLRLLSIKAQKNINGKASRQLYLAQRL